MKKSSGGISKIDMSGMPPEDEGAPKAIKKKKKLKRREAHVPVEVEDNKFRLDGVQKKKKKKKPEQAVALIPASKKQLEKVSKGKQEVIRAVEEYVALPESNDPYDIELRRIFEKLVDLAQRLEEQMEERIYNRDVYALNTIYSQIRETMADLRATRDISSQIGEIMDVVVRPYHRAAGQALMNVLFQMSHSISEHVKDADRRKELLNKLNSTSQDNAAELQAEYNKLPDRIQQVLT